MNTTNLFVELMVIGIGAVSAVLLGLVACFDAGSTPLTTLAVDNLVAIFILAPLLALTYVLGIVVDRLADVLFKWLWADAIRGRYFADTAGGIDAYHRARRTVLSGPDRLAALIEYARSRMRICRGWAVNGVFLLIAWNLYAVRQLQAHEAFYGGWIVGNCFLIVLSVSCCWAWKTLIRGIYDKISHQHKFLASLPGAVVLPVALQGAPAAGAEGAVAEAVAAEPAEEP